MLLRPSLLLRRQFPRIWRRNLHELVAMDRFETGIRDFLSPGAFNLAYNEYQSLVLNRLNALVLPSMAGMTVEQIAKITAREPASAAMFNYASMAYNNHLFFAQLTNDEHPPPIPRAMKADLNKSFGSIDTLRKEFITTADTMFGPGFVWLMYRHHEGASVITAKSQRFFLLTTYLAGSPFPEAHFRAQRTAAVNTVGKLGPQRTSEGGVDYIPPPGGFATGTLIPILCLNTWEHVWLPDYGIHGKFNYCQNWWNRIDWQKVEEKVPARELEGK